MLHGKKMKEHKFKLLNKFACVKSLGILAIYRKGWYVIKVDQRKGKSLIVNQKLYVHSIFIISK